MGSRASYDPVVATRDPAAMSYRSVFRPHLFQNRIVVVTGAGRGIGRCTAIELASLGAHVALIARRREDLNTVCEEIIRDGNSASTHPVDIRLEAQVQATIRGIVEQYGPVDGLVNNAHGESSSPLAGISQQSFETSVRTNLVGGFVMAREIYGQCMLEHGGSIVNVVADMSGGMPGWGHAGAAKAGMVNLTQTAAAEWAAAGVRINAVMAGYVIAGLAGRDSDDASLLRSERQRRVVPLKRLGTESEVSAAICFLLSEAAAYISGICLRVDGGTALNTRIAPLPDHHRSTPYDGFA